MVPCVIVDYSTIDFKKFSLYNGKYYTYGGFGNYIVDFSKYFNKVILLAHIENIEPPNGYYEINIPNIEIISLPVTGCSEVIEDKTNLIHGMIFSWKKILNP